MVIFGFLLNSLVVGLFVMAVVSLVIPLPKNIDTTNYTVSLRLMSFTFVYLGVFCAYKSSYYPTDLFCLPFIFTTSFQVHLLGISHINMLNSKYFELKYVLKTVSPFLLFSVVCGICLLVKGYHRIDSYSYFFENIFSLDTPDIMVRTLWFFYYVGCAVYYIRTFFSEEAALKEKEENPSAVINKKGLSYIHCSFMFTIVVLVSTFVVSLSPNIIVCAIANLIILLLYFGSGFIYIQYPKTFLPANDPKNENAASMQDSDYPAGRSDASEIWKSWRNRVVTNKYYLRSGITIVQLAQLLGTNRNTLSATINQNEGKNFNTFINELRIAEAKGIMRENPSLTLADICTRVGYSDQTNFSRHFKEITGTSPVAWKVSQKLV